MKFTLAIFVFAALAVVCAQGGPTRDSGNRDASVDHDQSDNCWYSDGVLYCNTKPPEGTSPEPAPEDANCWTAEDGTQYCHSKP
ncbi:hypothetical protein quinque_015401 [Culex quinquefasciatus]